MTRKKNTNSTPNKSQTLTFGRPSVYPFLDRFFSQRCLLKAASAPNTFKMELYIEVNMR